MNAFLLALLIAVTLSGCSTSPRDAANTLGESRHVVVVQPAQQMGGEANSLIDHILEVALPHQSYPWHTPDRVRGELHAALAAATLIVEATVTNESARIASASGKWINGWPERYPVFIISPTNFLRGQSNETTVIIEHMRSGSSIDISAFPDRYFRNGEKCVFFLRPNDKVSRWSGRKIWDIVKGVPIKDA